MIPDYRHEGHVKALQAFKSVGYTFDISSIGYSVRFKKTFVHGARIMLPRQYRTCWQNTRADIREYIFHSVMEALRHRKKMHKSLNFLRGISII